MNCVYLWSKLIFFVAATVPAPWSTADRFLQCSRWPTRTSTPWIEVRDLLMVKLRFAPDEPKAIINHIACQHRNVDDRLAVLKQSISTQLLELWTEQEHPAKSVANPMMFFGVVFVCSPCGNDNNSWVSSGCHWALMKGSRPTTTMRYSIMDCAQLAGIRALSHLPTLQ